MPLFCNGYARRRAPAKRLKSRRVSRLVESLRRVAAMARYNRRYTERRDLMAINSSSLPFTETLVGAAPQAAGVFALWQGGGIVYYGRADAIRRALAEHFAARALGAQRVSGCSWEISADPEARYQELMREYAAAHCSVPLWNDPQRLPTA
jgi:hypothetical protein